jgi:DNA-binding HxlR family transcriptional regulator
MWSAGAAVGIGTSRTSRLRSGFTQIAFKAISRHLYYRGCGAALRLPDCQLHTSTDNFVSATAVKFPTQCPVAFTTRIMGGKWKARIVWALIRTEKMRFSDLRRACPPISDRILTKELKELEACGLISRKEVAVLPLHTEYELTALGRTLEPLMAAMAEWGMRHRSTIDASSGS